MKRENPDGSFNITYPDGSRDTGTYNNDGDLVISYADGSHSVIREDGSETFEDPFGIKTVTTVAEDGRITEVSSDGWTTIISADGLTEKTIHPDGYVETTIYSQDGSFITTGSDGSSTRYDATSNQTTFVDQYGAIDILRIDQEGNYILNNSFGDVIEYNALTNTSIVKDADGNIQSTERTENGGYLITLQDGTVLELDTSGNPINNDYDVEVTSDGLKFQWDESNIANNSISNIQWDNETNTLTAEMQDNDTIQKTTIGNDGSVTVEANNQIFTYDLKTGVTGINNISYELDQILINTSGSGSAIITEDGKIFTIENEGTQATATQGIDSIIVEIDGEIYEYSY